MKKDNIEDVYGQLESFSKAPPKELWDNIESRLHPNKKKRGVFFIWGSAAAVLVFFVGYIYTNSLESSDSFINEITDIEQSTDKDAISESKRESIKLVEDRDLRDVNKDSLVEEPSIAKEVLNTVKNLNQLTNSDVLLEKEGERKNDSYEKNMNVKKESTKYNNSYSQNIIKEKGDKINTENSIDLLRKNKNIINHEKEKLTASVDSISKVKDLSLLDMSKELVAYNEKVGDTTTINKVANSKWSVEVLGGLSNTASESSLQGLAVNTTPQNDFVYALKFGYSISDKLVVKSGIGKNVLGQDINNIRYVTPSTTMSIDNFQSIVSNQDIIILGSQESNDISTFQGTVNEGSLRQQFNYFQVPLEFSYNIVRAQKIDLSLGMGGNINFLNTNRAFLDNEQIGENLGANTTIFGATINSNISYEISKKIILILEPSYNYFEKPIDNNNQTFKNTQFRALFGLQYKL